MTRSFVALAVLLLPAFCAGQTAQTIDFPQPDDATLEAGTVTITATTSATGLSVIFDSTTTSKCTVSGTTVTLVAVGLCSITATQPGGSSGGVTYSAASPVSRSFMVSKQFPGVDAVLGIGSLITGNHTNYKVNSGANVLEGTQIGRASPQLMAGLSFQLPFPMRKNPYPIEKWNDAYRPWHAFVSLKFSTDSTQTIVGYTFGVTYRIQKYLDLLAGYTLTPFQEPAPGFRATAAYVVATNPKLYPTFNAPALNNNHVGAFDGFPLQCITGAMNCGATGTNPPAATGAVGGTSIYAGNALESHYRGGFMLGISVPVALNSILGIPKK